MKNLFYFILTIIYINNINAQTQDELRDAIWANSTKEFKVSAIPDKWKNESAVIIASETNFTADKTTRMEGFNVVQYISQIITHHQRIKLLDNSAVKTYSQLHFNNLELTKSFFGKTREYLIIGVKVIKPDGKEYIVNLKEAVKAETGSDKANKIAVPNLEVNDIIDYFSSSKSDRYSINVDATKLMQDDYPMLYENLTFKIPEEYKLEALSLHNAPSFSMSKFEKDVTYKLEQRDVEKIKKRLWMYSYRSLPLVKYEIVSARAASKSADNYHFNENNLKSNLKYASSGFYDIGIIIDYFKKNFEKNISQTKLVNELFFLLRNPLYQKIYFNGLSKNPLENDNISASFFSLYLKVLKKYKINYQVCATPYRTIGSLNEVFWTSEFGYYIKVIPNDGPPIFIGKISPFLLPNKISYKLENNSAFIYNEETDGIELSTTGSYTTTTKDNNKTEVTYHVNLDSEDNSKLNITRKVESQGHNKLSHQYAVVTPYDYYTEYTNTKYEVSASNLFNKMLKEYKEEKSKYEQRKTQDYQERDDNNKKSIEDGAMVLSEYKDFKLISSGLWYDTPLCEYSDKFTVENICKKAGNNLLIELPMLIESQTEFNETEEKDRTEDVYMDFARSYNYVINFDIPEGYAIEGIETLNKKIDSKYGGFESKATIDGNKLIIKTYKYYSSNFIEIAEWPLCKDFMNTAVNFTKQKVLLKKI